MATVSSASGLESDSGMGKYYSSKIGELTAVSLSCVCFRHGSSEFSGTDCTCSP